MIRNPRSIETIVLRIEEAFLDRPGMSVTLPQAVQRFKIDRTTCAAVLDALVDADVLTRSTAGVYSRFFPLSYAALPASAGTGTCHA